MEDGMSNFIPRKVKDFIFFTRKIAEFVDERVEEWTHIPDDAFTDLVEKMNILHSAQENMIKDDSRQQHEKRNMAHKECEKALRHFIKFYLRNPIITRDELVAMGIPPLDNVRTQHTKVEEAVDMLIKLRYENELIVHFRQRGADNRAKPKGYDGAVIIWAIGDAEPDNLKDYDGHVLASKTPYAVKFDTHKSGNRVWFRAAWQNARGIIGEYCEAKSAVIP